MFVLISEASLVSGLISFPNSSKGDRMRSLDVSALALGVNSFEMVSSFPSARACGVSLAPAAAEPVPVCESSCRCRPAVMGHRGVARSGRAPSSGASPRFICAFMRSEGSTWTGPPPFVRAPSDLNDLRPANGASTTGVLTKAIPA